MNRRRTSIDIADVTALAAAAVPERPDFVHLTTPAAVMRYARKADEIAELVPPGGSVLDWGCGAGLMSFLLARRGLAPSAVDIALPPWVIAREAGVEPQVAPGRGARLPFADDSFAAVVGAGVLEHVADQAERLAELRRVLEPRGLVFVYNYPNALSWVEWVFERLYHPQPIADAEGNVHGHERKLRREDLVRLVSTAGFEVLTVRAEDLLPVTLRGVPGPLRSLVLGPRRAYNLLDRGLVRFTPLQTFGTNLTLIGRRA